MVPALKRRVVFAIRGNRAGSESFIKEIRQAIWSVNPDVPLAGIRTVEGIYRGSMAWSSFALVMLAIAGGMALLLGIVGIYGVIFLFGVAAHAGDRDSHRSRSPGIGAEGGGHGVLLAAAGVALGLAALGRVLSSLLFEVSPLDPVTYCAVSAGLLAAAAAASYIPAHRASAVDPIQALRAE